ncbi:Transcription termination factor MTERF4, chloroplastic [Coccomyxa sp. Obi]|nr:Transcription termination factor MTERF4, chloroplastic [Coccomyxa sp. Obi]
MHARTPPVVSSHAHSFNPGLATYLLSRRNLTGYATQSSQVLELGVRSPSYTTALLQYFKEKPSTPEQGLLRSKATDDDEEQYWEASARQMYAMLGQTVSLEWCHGVLKASFQWRHNRIGNKCPCSEIPTASLVEKRLALVLQLGLSKENAILMLTRVPSILGHQSQQMLHIADYIASLGSFSTEDVAVLLQREPRILGYNLIGAVIPAVNFLRSVGIKDEKLLQLLLSAPRVLGMSVERTLHPAVSLLKEMGFTGDKLVSVIVTSPSLLCLKPAKYASFCKLLEEYGIGDEARAKLVQNLPSCLTMSIRAARVKLQTFVEVAVAQEDLDPIFKKRPYVWRTSEKSMRHSASYLRSNLGFNAEELRSLVLRDPLIISVTKDKLAEKCSFLLGLGLIGSQIKLAIRRFPTVFQLSVEQNMVPKIQFLLESGFTREQIALLVTGFPQLLGLTIENIALKLSYLVDVLKRDISEAVGFPVYFGCSLAGRIRPRFAFIERYPLDRRLSLSSVLVPTDANFCRLVKTSHEDFAAFKLELSATAQADWPLV